MGKQTSGQATVPWRWVGERGLRIVTGTSTLAHFAALSAQRFAEVEDLIPADDSLLLVLRRGASVSAALQAALMAPLADVRVAPGPLREIPVEYGGVFGPDLPVLAEAAGMDVDTYVGCHAAAEYTVAFLGFQPGFGYLRGLPVALQAPRRATPRVSVPAGSVAIGGAYTAVYPAAGPGGWQIIGRTPVVMFDPEREVAALLLPGDRVRFVAA